jgi:hypothetical protein
MPKQVTDLTRLKGGSKAPAAKAKVGDVQAPRRRITANPLKPGKPVKPK